MNLEDRKYRQSTDLASLEPAARVKQLAQYGGMVDIDPNVPARRYYRSGLEMVRMANVYLAEGSLENAYILYMKFMTLFVEKIRKHPEYGDVPTQVKLVNQAKLKEVMPKAEKLKQKILDQYSKDHKKYLLEEQKRLQAVQERRKQEQEDAKLAEKLQADEERMRNAISQTPTLRDTDGLDLHPSAPSVDGVLYPDDFATTTPRKPTHDYKPMPPLIPNSRPPVDVAFTEVMHNLSGGRLRTVVVPSALMARFLHLAATNTNNNIETCGILAGILERGQFKVTHTIVPKQTGTSDSCSTNNEEEIFMYQDQHNLITLGWIHTHPTQTAFLSSVDLHTQCSYQLMMPEAIAIVCAPKYNETGYFALTTDGMQFITNCRQTGFHPHPSDPPLFNTVSHIKLDDASPLEMVDLRR